MSLHNTYMYHLHVILEPLSMLGLHIARQNDKKQLNDKR